MRDRGDSVITEEETEDEPAGVFNFGGDDDDMTTGATTSDTTPRISPSRRKEESVVSGVYLMGNCSTTVPTSTQNDDEMSMSPTETSESELQRTSVWSIAPVEDFSLVRSQVCSARSTDQVRVAALATVVIYRWDILATPA
eukprot:TRINITY_DN33199_c0_g1_i1.p1 TRINITY_DN33199_c0_g1~~TRINITY_DN33199_c0_g1_i1.p1  ORF type:complete len:141 (+),score=9.13 TRINITY_DN33199_c0_g1_i1:2-424(+)